MIFISASVLILPGTDGDGVTGVVVEGTTIKKIIKALKKHEHSRQSQNLSWFFKELLKRLLMLSYIPSVQALTSVFLTEVWTSELVLVTTILTFLPGTPLNVAVTGVSPTVVTGLVYQIHEN